RRARCASRGGRGPAGRGVNRGLRRGCGLVGEPRGGPVRELRQDGRVDRRNNPRVDAARPPGADRRARGRRRTAPLLSGYVRGIRALDPDQLRRDRPRGGITDARALRQPRHAEAPEGRSVSQNLGRWISLLIAAAMAALPFGACASKKAPAPLNVTDANSGDSVALARNQQLVVRLPSNPTTGYRWALAQQSTPVLEPEGAPTYEKGAGAEGASRRGA